jgi:hypothetical protein
MGRDGLGGARAADRISNQRWPRMSPRPFELSYRLTNLDYREMMEAYWVLTPFRRGRVIFLQMIPVAAAAFAAYAWWKTGLAEALGLAALALSAPVVAPLINNWA